MTLLSTFSSKTSKRIVIDGIAVKMIIFITTLAADDAFYFSQILKSTFWSFALSDTAIGKDKSYKQMKAKLGMRKVRPWKWMPFKNPARKDDLVLYHWRRATEKGQDYAFAKFNKKLEVRKP